MGRRRPQAPLAPERRRRPGWQRACVRTTTFFFTSPAGWSLYFPRIAAKFVVLVKSCSVLQPCDAMVRGWTAALQRDWHPGKHSRALEVPASKEMTNRVRSGRSGPQLVSGPDPGGEENSPMLSEMLHPCATDDALQDTEFI